MLVNWKEAQQKAARPARWASIEIRPHRWGLDSKALKTLPLLARNKETGDWR
jgi:hypothetical protein